MVQVSEFMRPLTLNFNSFQIVEVVIVIGWTRRGSTSGFLKLWRAVLEFTAMNPVHCFIIEFKLVFIVSMMIRC